MPPRMKIIIFEFLVLIKYFLFIISILGILVQAHRKNLVQANVQCTMYNVQCTMQIFKYILFSMYIVQYNTIQYKTYQNWQIHSFLPNVIKFLDYKKKCQIGQLSGRATASLQVPGSIPGPVFFFLVGNFIYFQ